MSQRLYRKHQSIVYARFATCVTSLLIVYFTGAYASLAEPIARLLPFPSSYSVGRLMALKGAPSMFGTCSGSVFAEARGLVKLPPEKLIKFAPNSNFYQHPQCLLKLPRNAFDFAELRFLSMSDAEDTLCDSALGCVGHISSLRGLDLDKSDASDAGMSRLGAMPQLETITACESKITGSCLPKLLACKKLKAIRLSNVVVSNDSLRYLKDFPHLQYLSLVRVDLSLTGVENLSKCTELQMLYLDNNRHIDDEAVPMLLKLTKLKQLWIPGTSISLNGLERLAKLHLQAVNLPKPLYTYLPNEKLRIKKAFPGAVFEAKAKPSVDSYTDTMFAPITR